MTKTILRNNATPIYAFLSFINSEQVENRKLNSIKILDCGAGGRTPPLALFYEHGFDTWGIDISDEQLEKARQYCNEKGLQINFRNGDMRQIPFDDESFEYVYEHYSMCHLSKDDTAKAIGEMYRVTKNGGACFLGLISTDSYPKSSYGKESKPGEYWMEEESGQVRHSMFTDKEADELVSGWEILSKEKRVIYLRDEAQQTSIDKWMEMYKGMEHLYAKDIWREQYNQRLDKFNYTHIYYFLRRH